MVENYGRFVHNLHTNARIGFAVSNEGKKLRTKQLPKHEGTDSILDAYPLKKPT